MYSLTLFKHLGDTSTKKRMNFDSWDSLVNLLKGLSKVPKKSKRSAQLISPATYHEGTTRANANVINWAKWCAVDVDDVTITGSVQNYVDELMRDDVEYVCYSTASSKPDKPKFRVVVNLDRPVEAEEIRHFWFAMNKHLNDIGDGQCKDLSRMYYTPGKYKDAHNFFFQGGSNSLCVDDLLNEYEYVETRKSNSFFDNLPEEIQNKVIAHRKESMEKPPIHWSSYKDCPFVNKKLVTEYKKIAFTDNSGRYASIYTIMVSIATLAIKNGYPIASDEIVQLIREIDIETSNRYQKRPLDVEANRAIEFAYRRN